MAGCVQRFTPFAPVQFTSRLTLESPQVCLELIMLNLLLANKVMEAFNEPRHCQAGFNLLQTKGKFKQQIYSSWKTK